MNTVANTVGIDKHTQIILLVVWVGSVVSILLAFIWVALRIGPKHRQAGHQQSANEPFDDEFRTKLRERGVLRFERTLDQHAAFLQQDLHKISDEVAEHIKEQAANILSEEFTDQKQSVAAAQQHLSETFARVDQAVEVYGKTLSDELHKELIAEKQRRLDRFTENMSDVITHHIQESLGNLLPVDEQVAFIIKNLEENKTAIVEDIKREL